MSAIEQKRRRYGRGKIDEEVRHRVAAWVRYEMEARGVTSERQMAEQIGVSHAYLSRVLRLKQSNGLELLLRAKQKLGISIDRWVSEDPEPRFYKPTFPRGG